MNENINENENRPFTLLDVIVIFLVNKKKIFIYTFIICLISIVLYFFVFDLIYLSTASIKSTGKSSSILSSIEGLPDMGGLDEIGLGGSKSAKELASYEQILTSRRCLEPLIQKFGLMERDDYRFMEDAVKYYREEKLVINQDRLSGVMSVGVYDKNPVMAKEMVEYLLQELDKINIEINIQNAKNNREFIENRFIKAKEDLTKAEDSLKSFQMIYGVAPDLQIKAAAQSAFTLEAELKAEEVKLDVLKKILSPDQVEVKTQQAKIDAMKEKIINIQNSTDLTDFLRLGNSPQIAISFLRLQREVEIQTKILTFILPLFEQAKIEEKRETPTISILDKPVVAERKKKPKRLTMVVVVTFIGFIFVNGFYIVKYKARKLKNSIIKAKENF